jgi:hypothetical protein
MTPFSSGSSSLFETLPRVDVILCSGWQCLLGLLGSEIEQRRGTRNEEIADDQDMGRTLTRTMCLNSEAFLPTLRSLSPPARAVGCGPPPR